MVPHGVVAEINQYWLITWGCVLFSMLNLIYFPERKEYFKVYTSLCSLFVCMCCFTSFKGPSALAMDFSFTGFDHVYGIPEHADSLALKQTT